MTPGKRLRELRRAAKLTARELGVRAAEVAGRDKPISESAVRNQENGTNGIPIDLAVAYAKVLNSDLTFILSGETEDRSNEPNFIPVVQSISGRPGPMGFASNRDRVPSIQITVDGYEEVELSAYQVVDDSLEPEFMDGDFLIVAQLRDVEVFDGDCVVVSSVVEKVVWDRLMRIKKRGISVSLFPVGQKSGEMKGITVIRGDRILSRVFFDTKVIASYRPPRLTRPDKDIVVIPDYMIVNDDDGIDDDDEGEMGDSPTEG
jgi:transcriptional regulator with XRE-family HTH domain